MFQFDLTKCLENLEKNVHAFSDPKEYDEATMHHPFYIEMAEEIKKEVRKSPIRKPRVLEIGCGPGTLTQFLVDIPFGQYFGIEPNKAECEYFRKKFAKQLAHDSFRIINGSFMDFDPKVKFDIVVASFVDHHISYEEKLNYYKRILSFLEDGGMFLSGEELLGEYSNNDERIMRLFEYHGYIIKTCIEEAHFDMAKIEARALKNGIEKWDEYKININAYRKLIQSAGMKIIRSEKLGPMEIEDGGIYVSVMHK